MVLCQELSAADYGAGGQPAADLERKFYGLWTTGVTGNMVLDRAYRYNPELQQTFAQVQEIAAAAPTAQPDDLGTIVSRVVDSPVDDS